MSIESTDEQFMLGATALAARIYRNDAASAAAPLVLHLHGGAFVDGSVRDGEGVATLLAEAGATVVSTDYPLAPQHRFPEAIDHLFGVLKLVDTLRGRRGRKKVQLIVAGEEAGGNLAAALAMMARDQQMPKLDGQILIAPMLDPCVATASMRLAEAGPVGCCWADGWCDYLGSAEKAAHPYASPANASRLAGLAPALVVTAEDDPMRDESLSYAGRLREAGVTTLQSELAAPTRWPLALRAPSLRQERWASALRTQFARFFEAIAFGRPDVAAHTVRA